MDFSAEECFLEKHEYEVSEKMCHSVGRFGTPSEITLRISLNGKPSNISPRDLLAVVSRVALESGGTVEIEKTEGSGCVVESLSPVSLAEGGDTAIKRYLNGMKDDKRDANDEFIPAHVDDTPRLGLGRIANSHVANTYVRYDNDVDQQEVRQDDSDAFSIVDSEQSYDPNNGDHYIDSEYADSGPITDDSDNAENCGPEYSVQDMYDAWRIPARQNGTGYIVADSDEEFGDLDVIYDDGDVRIRPIRDCIPR